MNELTSSSDDHRAGGDWLDAHLNLLDRQVIDNRGRLVAKVDDVELRELAGGLVVSGLLTGPGALGPRIGGAPGAILTATWARLAGRAPDQPKRIDWSLVEDIGTAIHLRIERERVGVDGFEVWTRERLISALPGSGQDPEVKPAGDIEPRAETRPSRDEAPEGRHRLDRLLGCHVRFADGRDGDLVIDATMTRTDPHDQSSALRVEGLVIGRRRPGTLFGYHRHPKQGPWLVRIIVRALHRHTVYVDWDDVRHVDWDARLVQLGVDECRPLATDP